MSRDVGAVIGKDITVRGEIEGREDLRIEGIVEGTVRLEAELIIGQGGSAAAELDVSALTVEGAFDGSVTCHDLVRLAPGCNVTGTIASPRVVIDEGAVFTGTLEMDTGIEGDEAAHG